MKPYAGQLRSRRVFLKIGLLGIAGAGIAHISRVTQPVGAWNFYRWTARGRWRQMTGDPEPVAVARCPGYGPEVLDCLRDLWQAAEMPDVAGKRVLVKPNLIDLIDGYPVTTDPTVVAAVVDLLQEHGAAEVVVGEGPGFRRDAWPVVEATGLASVLAARGTEFVDLNYDDPAPVPARDGWFLKADTLWLPKHVREADLIVSVPKLKTHHWTGVSLGMKNLFGIVPGVRYGWPKNMLHINGIPLSICGLLQSVPPVVTVVDGIVGMEGDGPLFGAAVPHGLLAAGRDAVAVDATCARLMGYGIDEVDYLALAGAAGLGKTEKIEVRGASLGDLRRQYRRPPPVT